jgi:Reductase C-terminal
MCPTEISQDRVAAAVRQRCRSEKVAQREFIAFWLAEGRVLVGMNVNVWDVNAAIQDLVRAGRTVDAGRVADPGVPLGAFLAD